MPTGRGILPSYLGLCWCFFPLPQIAKLWGSYFKKQRAACARLPVLGAGCRCWCWCCELAVHVVEAGCRCRGLAVRVVAPGCREPVLVLVLRAGCARGGDMVPVL